MFPVMNNLEIKRTKEKLKNRILGGGGFHAVLETHSMNKYFKYF
jgi:hypothetical protein